MTLSEETERNREYKLQPLLATAPVFYSTSVRSREPGAEAVAGKVSERPETPRAYEPDRGQAGKLTG